MSGHNKKRILIIEDEPAFYRNYFEDSTKIFVDTSKYSSFSQIKDRINNETLLPDIIILDLVVLKGNEEDLYGQFIAFLKKLLEKSLPIIVISQYYNNDTRGLVLELGGVDLLSKSDLPSPESKVLDEILATIISKHQKKQATQYELSDNCLIKVVDSRKPRKGRPKKDIKIYTKGEFRDFIYELIKSPKITPCYYFIHKKINFFTGVDEILSKEDMLNGIKFSRLKKGLRERVRGAYLNEPREMILDLSDLTKGQITKLTAEQKAEKYLNGIMSKVFKNKSYDILVTDGDIDKIKDYFKQFPVFCNDTRYSELISKMKITRCNWRKHAAYAGAIILFIAILVCYILGANVLFTAASALIVVIGLFANIAQVTGYSLKDFLKKK